ncbi:MAG TPA: hypothetical protein VK656_06580 [Candidatus Acidoferrum sp.]|nr:hypothetical protein [Candidatus Acidoferrum sp.]
MTENTAVCSECGAVASATARFCETCGATLPPVVPQHSTGVTSASGLAFVSGPFDPLETSTGAGQAPPTSSRPIVVPATPPEAALAPLIPPATTRGPDAVRPGVPAGPSTAPAYPNPPATSSPAAGGRANISAAIPSASKAGLAPARHPTAPAEKPHFFTEQYAGSEFASPPPGPIVSAPVPTLPPADGVVINPSRRLGCIGAITILLGLNWLIQGVLGFVQAAITWRTGSLLGQELAPDIVAKVQIATVVGGLVSIVWILIGVKIILAPGRWSLGFTGVCFFINAIAILLGLAFVQHPPTSLVAVVTGLVLFEVVMGLAALTAAQAMD